jgi:glycosyltransferase involved in cell wall biosynthesis
MSTMTLFNRQLPRILLLADGANWIFERHCYAIKTALSDSFDFTIRYSQHPFDENSYDLIYSLEWDLVPPEKIINPLKYITGIRGHVRWPNIEFRTFIDRLRHNFQRVHVVSKRLHSLFDGHLPFLCTLSHGVDTEFYKLREKKRSDKKNIRIGWAGNKNAPADKGYDSYIEPLSRLPGVDLISAGYDGALLTMSDMRDFYESIDVYVCASLQEGNNNPLMESGAMECAIITTDNGTVPEYLEHRKSALIIERTVGEFIAAVEFLRDHPEERFKMGKAARQRVVAHWDWKLMAEGYKKFFNEALLFQASTLSQMNSFMVDAPHVRWMNNSNSSLHHLSLLQQLVK